MQFGSILSTGIIATTISSVMASGPPAGCRQTNVPHFGGICVCTTTVLETGYSTITTTTPVVTTATSTSTLLGPSCYPPSW